MNFSLVLLFLLTLCLCCDIFVIRIMLQFSVRRNLMKYNIAICGTFNVDNYGDVMFPEVFKRAMKNRGLDFDPLPFSENAKIYETTGYYTTYVKGFKLYDDFER